LFCRNSGKKMKRERKARTCSHKKNILCVVRDSKIFKMEIVFGKTQKTTKTDLGIP